MLLKSFSKQLTNAINVHMSLCNGLFVVCQKKWRIQKNVFNIFFVVIQVCGVS